MNVMDAIKTRRSIRSYQDRPVEAEKLQQVLEAARIAPSASNSQDWKFIVVTDPQTRQSLVSACYNQAVVGQAPVVIAACSTNPTRVMASGQSAAAVDLSIAVDHMTLAAVQLGLGTCWIGAFDASAVAKLLDLSAGIAVIHILPLGYPASSPPAHRSKRSNEVIRFD